MSRAIDRVVVLLVTLFCFGAGAEAQQGNTPQTTSATVTKDFEVIAVDGTTLTVRLPEGTRQMTVPDDFRFNVDGRQMSVRELKPGMKGTANITTRTTTTPVTVTEVRNGEVVVANAGNIIVRTADGSVRSFTPTDAKERGITIVRDGQPVEMRELHPGDRLSATIVSQRPPRVITEREVQATLARAATPAPAAPAPAPAPAPRAAAQAPAPPAPATPAPAATSGTQTPEAAPRTLPSTASPIPLIGLVGLMSLSAGAMLTAVRRRRR